MVRHQLRPTAGREFLKTLHKSDFRMTRKNGCGKCSLFVLSANGWKDPLRFPVKENLDMEKALFDWPIVLQYDVKAKYRVISRKFLGMKLFQPSVRLTKQKPRAFVSIQIALFPFVCCSWFVHAFSFHGHMEIALVNWFGLCVFQALRYWGRVNRVFSLSDCSLRYSPLTEILEQPSSAHFRYLRILGYICHA